MKFVKSYSGNNDFIILDSRLEKLPGNIKSLIPALTDRYKGIGADGVIIVENSKNADFGLRYFNPDASEYTVCGNGSLCAVFYAGASKTTFSTGEGVFKGEIVSSGKVFAQLPGAKKLVLDLSIKIQNPNPKWMGQVPHPHPGGDNLRLSFADVGVPHTIYFVDNIDKIDFDKLGRTIRYHTYFGKEGTNVNFVQVVNKNKIKVRTYERGVEGETDCGSGSCSACIVGWAKKKLSSPIEVITRGGKLKVYIDSLDEIRLQGNPKIVYKGETDLGG